MLKLKSLVNKNLDLSLKEWSEGKKSIGEVAKENKISIWKAMDEAKKRNFTSAITLSDLRNNLDFEL
jgi:hypothetical protein